MAGGQEQAAKNLYKNLEQVWNQKQKDFPQGLKPLFISPFFGTTEVVPLQNSMAAAVFIQVLRAKS